MNDKITLTLLEECNGFEASKVAIDVTHLSVDDYIDRIVALMTFQGYNEYIIQQALLYKSEQMVEFFNIIHDSTKERESTNEKVKNDND